MANRKNKRIYGTDIYKNWVESGKLAEVLAFITECAKKLVSQKEMCRVLKINANTFSSMKKIIQIFKKQSTKLNMSLKKI